MPQLLQNKNVPKLLFEIDTTKHDFWPSLFNSKTFKKIGDFFVIDNEQSNLHIDFSDKNFNPEFEGLKL